MHLQSIHTKCLYTPVNCKRIYFLQHKFFSELDAVNQQSVHVFQNLKTLKPTVQYSFIQLK